MDSRQLTTSLSNTRNSSKQAMPLSLNMTLSFIGKRFEVIHVNQDKTKTSMTKPMPSPSRCITRRVLDISSPPSQSFSSGHNPAPTRHWRTNSHLLPHYPSSPQFAANDLLTLQTADQHCELWQLTFPTP